MWTSRETSQRVSLLSDRAPRLSVGLVLSGGAARGLVHIGVLSVLEEYGVGIDLIVGASFGSLVAAYFASGYSPEQMLDYAREFRLWPLRDFRPPWTGFFSGERVQRLFERGLGSTRIEDLSIPVVILAADLEREEPVLLERGSLPVALCASSAFPGLFAPVRVEGRLLTDGGIVGSVAVGVARKKGAGLVLSCDVSVLSEIYTHHLQSMLLKKAGERASRKRPLERKDSLRAVLRSTLRIIHRYRPGGGESLEIGTGDKAGVGDITDGIDGIYKVADVNDIADVEITPLGGEIRPLCFKKAEEGYRIGRAAAMRVIDTIVRKTG